MIAVSRQRLSAALIAALATIIAVLAVPAIAAPAGAADQGGGAYGWRCYNNGNGNTLYQIKWLDERTTKMGCETDVMLIDGQWAVWHDPDLHQADTTTLPPGIARTDAPERLTWAQFRNLRYRSGKKLRVATARGFFRTAARRNINVMAEIKTKDATQEQYQALADLADQYGTNIRWEVFDKHEDVQGEVTRQMHIAGATRVGGKSQPSWGPFLEEIGATFRATSRKSITPEYVSHYRAHGVATRAQMAPPHSWNYLYRVLDGPRWVTNKPVKSDRWIRAHKRRTA